MRFACGMHRWYGYHVFVPLLLRLSNDVDKNPGPRNINEIVDRTFTVHADCHQGNASIFGSNAGKLCVAISLCSIVYSEIKSVNIWDTLIMNQILEYGNNLFSIITRSINKDFLLLTDVSEFVDIEDDTFCLEYSEPFSGALFVSVNNDPYVTLEHSFNEIFFSLNYKSCLLTIGMNTVAIFMPFPNVFKIFDSHSRDLHGMPCASGYAVLTSVEGVENLAEYFHFMSNSCHLNLHIPFEVKGFNCIKRNELSNRNSTEFLQFACFERESTISKHNTNMMASIREKKRVQRKNESSEQREK